MRRGGEARGGRDEPLTGILYGTGRWCFRHRRVVVAIWLLMAVALVIASRSTGAPTSDNLGVPGTDSIQAKNLLAEALPNQVSGTNPVVLKAESGKLTEGANKRAVEATVKSLRGTDHVVTAVSPVSKAGSAALSDDEKIGFISLTLDLDQSELDQDEAEAIIDAESPAEEAGLTVATGGYLGQEVSKPETHSSEAIGLGAAVIILMVALGSAAAMLLPIATAVIGLVTALALIGVLGNLVEVPTIGPTLATMIGLGVGIDYALFIVTRHKDQLATGMTFEESTARSVATSGSAVVFAGCTVVIALVSLAAAGIPLVSALGQTAAVSVLVAVAAAVTLLPALLGALGPRIDSMRVQLGKTHPDDAEPHGWRRWARAVANRPWPSATLASVVLLALAWPTLDLTLGQTDAGTLPKDTTSRQAYDLLSEGFGAGQNAPLLVAVQLDSPAKPDRKQLNQVKRKQAELDEQTQQATAQLEAEGLPPDQAEQQAQAQAASQQRKLDAQRKQLEEPASDPRLQKLDRQIDETKGVKATTPPALDKDKTVAVFTAIPTTPPSATATEDLVRELRDSTIPDAEEEGTVAYVGGQTAGYIDLADRIGDKLPLMILIVIALSFVVLLIAFRSIVLPLKAAAMNLLSVAAAYGVVTAIFEKGWGEQLVGLETTVPIQSFVPLLMFAILFGLSMDYEVFLLSQVQEHYKKVRDTHEAVVEGLAKTGRVITSAALIMVCVFSSFVLNGDPVVKQFGVGLAVAIAVDATLVRCFLVPALMVLMRTGNWWLPGWLDRLLPKIHLEGEEYFADRPAPQRPPD